MLFEVHQNVDQRVAYRARRRQRARVVAIAPDPAAPPEYVVHRAGETNGQTANAAGERFPVIGLDDEMDVLVLDAELEDAKADARRRGQCAADGGKDARRSETAKRLLGAQRDVQGMRGTVFRATTMGYAPAAAGRRLSSCAGPVSAPGRWRRKRELGWPARHDLIGLI